MLAVLSKVMLETNNTSIHICISLETEEMPFRQSKEAISLLQASRNRELETLARTCWHKSIEDKMRRVPIA